jgi:hypothetical protein
MIIRKEETFIKCDCCETILENDNFITIDDINQFHFCSPKCWLNYTIKYDNFYESLSKDDKEKLNEFFLKDKWEDSILDKYHIYLGKRQNSFYGNQPFFYKSLRIIKLNM